MAFETPEKLNVGVVKSSVVPVGFDAVLPEEAKLSIRALPVPVPNAEEVTRVQVQASVGVWATNKPLAVGLNAVALKFSE